MACLNVDVLPARRPMRPPRQLYSVFRSPPTAAPARERVRGTALEGSAHGVLHVGQGGLPQLGLATSRPGDASSAETIVILTYETQYNVTCNHRIT